MKITYDYKADVYRIDLEYPDTEIYIKATNIAEVREYFIERMSWLFEETIREQLKEVEI